MVQICRLCLQSSTDTLLDLASYVDKKQFDLILPEINIFIIESPVICTNCSRVLKEAYDFKTICLKTEQQLIDAIDKHKTNNLEELLKPDLTGIKEETVNNQDVKPESADSTDEATFEDYEVTASVEQFTNDTDITRMSIDASLTCQFCHKEYSHLKALKRHLKSHIEGKPECKICKRDFYDKTALKRHILRYHGDTEQEKTEKFVCKLCNKVFYYMAALRRHNRYRHLIKEQNLNQNLEGVTESVINHAEEFKQENLSVVNNKTEFKYHCSICNKPFRLSSSLKRHIKTHSNTEFECRECTKTFRLEVYLREHNRRVHNSSGRLLKRKYVRSYSCDVCQRKFPTLARRDNHKIELHTGGEVKYNCSICNKGFLLSSALKRHEKTHSNAEFECRECMKSFRLKVYLQEHNRRVHNSTGRLIKPKCVRSFSCEVCHRKFRTYASYNTHRNEHNIPKPELKCKFCDRQFTSKFFLYKHINQIHYDKREDLKYICRICDEEFSTQQNMLDHRREKHPMEEIQRYTCDTCGITLCGKANLKNHLLIHTGRKPYTCDIYNTSFYQVGSLNVHKKATHSNEKPFACGYCDRRFAVKGMLTKHLQSVHLKDMIERKYKCKFCEKSFRVQSTLKYHMRWHTNERLYSCDVCNKPFVDRSSVQKHRLIHFEKTNICEVCGKGFHQKSNLNIHMRVHQK